MMAESVGARMTTHNSPGNLMDRRGMEAGDGREEEAMTAEGKAVKGHPVQVVVANDDHSFTLDEKALEEVLLKPHVKDKKVVVVSVAGAFRKGKSFLLDFFLRYLEAKNKAGWLGGEESPLEGFSWRGGSERDTTGILLWSEPFIVKDVTGEEVAVLLMDTQGSFDSETTVRDCATVFALSTMLSSVQVYNLSQNIQEDNLQHLQLFTDYGRLALEANDNVSKPFQKLMFLVRDWSFPYEAGYGIDGGRLILDKRLQMNNKQHPELLQLRKHIRSCFNEMCCFLMPHPGLDVSTNAHFDGQLKHIHDDFKRQLEVLVPLLLAPENLVVKEINGSRVTCSELEEYFKAYIAIYQGEELPEPKSMLQATAEANNLAAVSTSKSHYQAEMEKLCGGDQPYMHPEELEREHRRILQHAMDSFHNTRKMGGSEFSQAYADKLAADLEESYHNYQKSNENKNILAKVKTPSLLLLMATAAYFMSWLMGIIGLTSPANLFMLFFIGCMLLTVFWAYARVTGEHRQIAVTIDEVAEFIWDHICMPAFRSLLPPSAQQTIASGIGVAEAATRLKRR